MADKYENITKTANTLWNNDESGQIAYAEQVGDGLINWEDTDKKYNGTYPNPKYDPDDPTKEPKTLPYVPEEYKNKVDTTGKNISKFQSSLNEFFLNHWADWLHFLYDEGVKPGIIDSWKEVQDFLEGISDEEAMTLLTFITNIELASGTLNIRMSEDYPGAVEAVETSPDYNVSNSKIDPETGAIKIVFNFERDI